MKIYRIIRDKSGILRIELGKHWEIEFIGEFKESVAYLRKGVSLLDFIRKQRSFTKVIKEGAIIPRWYGFTRRDFDRDVSIYQPIPINLIVAAWHWFKWTVVRRLKFEWPRLLWRHEIDIYCLGKKHGYTMGKYSREAKAKFMDIMTGTKDRSVS